MDHSHFKANQTAAAYIAERLDDGTQEAFEEHLMNCVDCVEDVEVWRAVKLEMPRPRVLAKRRFVALSDWRMAASLVGAGVVGAAGGWAGRSTQPIDLDSTRTLVFNLPAITRGADECTALRLASDTRLAVLRVPGVARDLRVVALDSEKRELPGAQFAARMQPDGSQLLRIDAQHLEGRLVHLEARRADGSTEPLGCVTGEKSPSDTP